MNLSTTSDAPTIRRYRRRLQILALASTLLLASDSTRAENEPQTENEPEAAADPPPDAAESSVDGAADAVPADDQSLVDSDDDRPTFREEVEIRERVDDLVGIAATSSQGVTGRLAIQARPIQRAGEVVETVPGMIATQHSGDGKANQYFVRGFNLDHGTDFRLTVAGLPVNMPSHGHGQGYADLNFLIPELVSRVRFAKGTALAEGGDFSAAGRADIELVNSLPEGFVELELGGYGYQRVVVGESFTLGQGQLTAALEAHGNDGPWRRGNNFERFNGFLRYTQGDALRSWTLTAMGYDGSWLSTDQVPQRTIDSGLIDRFDLIDPGPRGDSSRFSLSSDWRWGGERSATSLSAYALTYDLDLISNFTYQLENPERGDQFEQVDERTVFGAALRHHRVATVFGKRAEWSVGAEARFDDIDNGLFRTQNLERFETVRADTIEQLGLGAFGELAVAWADTFRTTFGLRVDTFDARVESDLSANSGRQDDLLTSPKLALVLGPWNHTEVFASAGYGFHSNDARGTTIQIDPTTGEAVQPVEPLVRAKGYEIGLRTSALQGLQSTVTVYRLDLDSELVFVGDGGATEVSGRSRRIGLEWTNAWQVNPAWTVELDAAWVDAELVDEPAGQREIPGAVDSVLSAGVVWRKSPWQVTARLRAFDGYPLTEDGTVEASAFIGLGARLERTFGRWTLSLAAFNLLDRKDNDVEYFYASRLPGEPAEGIEDIHLHPVERPNVRLGIDFRF